MGGLLSDCLVPCTLLCAFYRSSMLFNIMTPICVLRSLDTLYFIVFYIVMLGYVLGVSTLLMID